MRTFLPLAFASLSALLACTTTTTSTPGSAGTGEPTTETPGSQAGETGEETASSSGTSGTSGTAPGASSSNGGPSGPTDTRLFPVEVGRSWTYSVKQVSQGQTTTGTTITKITGKKTIDGVNAWIVSTTTGNPPQAYESYADVSGDDVRIRSSGTEGWMETVKAPVKDGASWTYSYYGTRKQTWREVGTQKVAAGTFDDCWRIDYVVAESSKPGDINYSVLCRGVGTVLVETKLSNGFQSHQELTSKSF